MKKKILIFLALMSIVACFFALAVSAETPSMYIEFGARFEGSDEYITVYTQNAESSGNPRINFKDYAFYSNVDFTQTVDMSNVTGLDFSVAVSHNSQNPVNRMTAPASPFTKCTEIKWFKEGYTSIENSLFKNFTALSSFDFGCLTTIDYNCFENTGFVKLVIPSTVTSIKNSTFAKCAKLQSVKFEGNLSSYGTGIFRECSSLTTVNIGGMTKICNNLFQDCTSVTNVIIPSTVTSIGSNAFRNTGIQSVVIPKNITSIGDYAFHSAKVTSVSFEEGFTGSLALGTGVFQNCTSLTSVELPEGITSIGKECFAGFKATSITIPDSVKSLGSKALTSDTLTQINFGANSQLETIDNAFSQCKALTSLTLPSGVTFIGGGFEYCYKLEYVYNLENANMLYSGQNIVPSNFFRECPIKEIKLPKTVTSISANAFNGSKKIEKIYIPSTVTSIDSSVFSNNQANTTIFYCGTASNLLSITGNSSFISDRITNNKVATYTTLDATYASGVIVENTNLCDVFYGSHLASDNTSFSFVDVNGNPIEGKNYLASINVYCECGRSCGSKSVLKTIDPMFVFDGFSTPTENGKKGLALGISVNEDSVDEYYKLTNKTISFGAYIASYANVTNDNVTDMYNYAKAIKADVTIDGVSYYAMRVTGFEKGGNDDTKLCLGAYVIENGVVSYLQAGEAVDGCNFLYTTYNLAYANSSNK